MSADSEQPEGGLATNAIDGNPATIWHTAYTPTSAPLPHAFSIAMRSSEIITGLRYQPRTDHPNGRIGQYQIHVSVDGTTWGNPVSTGTFADDATETTVTFTPTAARFVRLTALTEAGNRGPWSSAAEIDPVIGVQCAPSAAIYTTRSNGAFLQYQHLRPEAGANSWGIQQQISTFGFDARRVAGPDGIIYSALNNGELQRRRWNGTTWDTFPNGLTYETIDTNPLWSRYFTPEYFNRITVDPNGYIYTIEPDGNLHWRDYNPANRTWAHRVVDTNWGRFNLIIAADKGEIFARETRTWALYRFSYQSMSNRILDDVSWVRNAGQNWNRMIRMLSPGAGLLYGVMDTGELRWWDFNETANSVEPIAGKLIGTGWQNEFETFAGPDACQLVGVPEPTRPQITPEPNAPVDLVRSSNGHLHYSYVDYEGRAVYANIADVSGSSPAAAAAVPGLVNVGGMTSIGENQNGSIQIVARGLDSEVYTNRRTGVAWSTTSTTVGFMRSWAVLGRRPDNTLVVYAADAEDWPWALHQSSPNGPFNVWREPNGGWNGAGALEGRLLKAIHPSNDVVHLIGGGGPSPGVQSFYPDGVSLTRIGGNYTGFLPGNSSILMPDNTLRLFATLDNGIVQTQLGTPDTEDPSFDWTGWWVDIPGITAVGPPSATLAPDGKIYVVVRATDGFIHYTSQTAPGSPDYTAWQEITGFTEESATAPTALAVPESNTWVVAYRTDLDVPRLRRYQPATLAATSAAFADVPITPMG